MYEATKSKLCLAWEVKKPIKYPDSIYTFFEKIGLLGNLNYYISHILYFTLGNQTESTLLPAFIYNYEMVLFNLRKSIKKVLYFVKLLFSTEIGIS